MAAMGLGDGNHLIGQMQVKVEGKRAQLVGTNTLAGSIATMDDCVRHFIKEAGRCCCSWLLALKGLLCSSLRLHCFA